MPRPASHIHQLGCLVVMLLLTLGCRPAASKPQNGTASSSSPQEGHDVPATFEAAMAALEDVQKGVKQAFDAGSPSDCDDELHLAADILPGLAKLAQASNVGDEKVKQVAAASKAIFESYMKLHHGFHDDSVSTAKNDEWGEISSEIDEQMEILRNLRSESSPTAE